MNDHLKAHRDFQQVMDDSMSKLRETFQTWLQQRQEQVVNLDTYTPEPSQYRKIPICYDDDDDEESSIPLKDIIISGLPPCVAITPVLLTEEPVDSLIMEDKHLDTIPETESDELIKSSVEDLVHTPSESDGISESECDLPVCDDSSPKKDEVLDDIISIPPGNGNDHFNAESSLIESVLNRDNVISSPKIDFLLEEFAGELALIAPIPPGIVEADFDPKGDICFIENLMYDNSFPRPPETLKDDSETVIDSNNDYSLSDDDSPYSEDIDYVDALPPDPELVSLEVVGNVVQEDGEIDTDILLTIKDDILREKLLKVNLLIAKIEALKDNPTPSSNFVTKLVVAARFFLDLSLPDYEAFFCDSEPDSGNFTMDVVEDISDNPTRELYVHVLHDLPTHPTLQLDSDFTLSSDSLGSDLVVSFPSGTRNKIFDPGIFIEVFWDCDDSHDHAVFVLRSLELHILSFILGIQYPKSLSTYETDIRQKDEKQSQNDKTEHGMEERKKVKVKSQSQTREVKVKAVNEEILNGPTRTHLMGQVVTNDAPILSLPDGVEDFVVYCDASNQGLGCVLMQRNMSPTHFDQKELNMRQRRWIELFSDYECEIRYHLGKANVVADALSRKKWVKPKHVRAMAITIQSKVKRMILAAQGKAFNQENVFAERLHGLDQQMDRKGDESLYFMDRIWVPLVGGVRTVIMDEAYKSRYSVHPGADKMYYDLQDMYW
ncbi:putative reverse transcriptase domain-containing protein [Tanacetum coccineum]